MGARTLTQNSDIKLKIGIRKRFLKRSDYRVLDLFSGVGKMYHNVYHNNCQSYLGVDKEYIHTPGICVKANNEEYVKQNSLDYDVFDLDDYGIPWKLFYLCCDKIKPRKSPYIFFLTDGSIYKFRKTNVIMPIVSAVEGIYPKAQIFGLNHWYVDIFKAMLVKAQKKYKLDIQDIYWCKNSRNTCYYWCLNIIKQDEKREDKAYG